MEKTTPGLLQTKQHFIVLDGLRGVAALAVVVFHFMEVAYTDYSQDFIGHGFLAVDFFFCLSGFVIAYAYDSRIKEMGAWAFFKSRLIRLHPLVIFGSVLGLATFLFEPFGGPAGLYSAGKIALIFLSSVLLIPAPVMPERYLNLFSFNAPAWSLFWEYVANIFYAFILYKTGRRWLLGLAIIAAGVVCWVAFHTGNLMGGWGGPNFWDGCARICYSFLAGMLVYRFNWIIRSKMGFGILAVLLALAFVMPFNKWNWLTEPLVVLLYFPLIVALGAGGTLSPAFKKLCVFSGNISYPLYMTHYAWIWMFANYYNAHKPGTGQLALIIITSAMGMIGIAWLVMVVYDIPLRRYLNSRRNPALK